MAGGLAELLLRGGEIEDVVDHLEHHAVPKAVRRERVDARARKPGHDAADAGGSGEQRCGLAFDRRKIGGTVAPSVVLRPQLADLPFDEPTDGVPEQPGHLGTQRRGDLGRPGEQEIARQDRPMVAPAEVHRRHAAARLGLVDHVVVVERADLHQFDRDAALDDLVARRLPAGEGSGDGEHRSQSLASGVDQMLGDLSQIVVRRADSLAERRLDAFEVGRHAREGEQRGRGPVGH